MSKKVKIDLPRIIGKQSKIKVPETIVPTVKDNTKYIFLMFTVRDGEREHLHRVLYPTKCKNILFSIYWYIYHYWDSNTYHENGTVYAFSGEIAYKYEDHKELSKAQYDFLSSIMYG